MNVDRTAPIDEAHQISVEMRELIRDAFHQARHRVAVWEPKPCPEGPVREPLSTVV